MQHDPQVLAVRPLRWPQQWEHRPLVRALSWTHVARDLGAFLFLWSSSLLLTLLVLSREWDDWWWKVMIVNSSYGSFPPFPSFPTKQQKVFGCFNSYRTVCLIRTDCEELFAVSQIVSCFYSWTGSATPSIPASTAASPQMVRQATKMLSAS